LVAIHRTVHPTSRSARSIAPRQARLGRAFFFPSLVDCLRQCVEPFTRAVEFRAFFELLKSVFGIGTSLGCTIPRVVLGSRRRPESSPRVAVGLSPPLPSWPDDIADPDLDLSQ
jgi:hypothetical protein